MDCFIKKIFEGVEDEEVHRQFIRFGKGTYEMRAVISGHKTSSKIKLKASFEFANDFVRFVAELGGNFEASGTIMFKEMKNQELKDLGINVSMQEKRGGAVYEANLDKIMLNSEQLKKLVELSYSTLLSLKNEEIELKIKKKLPKPGKSAEKVDDKFCQLQLGIKYWPKVKEAFFWDLPDFKKVKINHTYIIEELIMPKDEKDFEKIRILTKRKGRIIRNIDIGGSEMKKESKLVG